MAGLVLKLKEGESFVIGDDITINIGEIRTVNHGLMLKYPTIYVNIVAPKDKKILRSELLQKGVV